MRVGESELFLDLRPSRSPNPPRCGRRSLRWAACLWLWQGLTAAPAQAPPQLEVPRFARHLFGEVLIASDAPCRDVRLTARFRHEPSGRVFDLPVVAARDANAAGARRAIAEVWFAPPRLGSWSFELLPPRLHRGAKILAGEDLRGTFECVPSPLEGPWQPDPARPGRIRVLQGDGQERSVFPTSTTYFTWLNPEESDANVRAALDDMQEFGLNRLRVALTSVQARNRPNDPNGPAPVRNHTVFARRAPTFAPNDIDFEDFDFDQWAVIDQRLALARERGFAVSVVLFFVTEKFDYEDFVWTDRRRGSGFHPLALEDSAFAHRLELFLWYAAGRLAAWPHVQWCLAHEWSLAEAPESGGPRRALGPEAIRGTPHQPGLGPLLASIDPYQHDSTDARLLLEVGSRGSFYGLKHQQLQDHPFAFTDPDDRTWINAVGLQRGGELGITSVERLADGALDIASPQVLPQQPMIYTHRGRTYAWPLRREGLTLVHRERSGSRPIFIEEDWISRNDLQPDIERNPEFQPAIAHSFTQPDNPYARYIGLARGGEPGLTGSVLNRNAFAFVPDNFFGLRKFLRDSAWMSGAIAQGYTSFWSRRYAGLSEPVATRAHQPFRAVRQAFAERTDFARFRYDPTIVLSQSRLVPLSGLMPIHGRTARGARSDWTRRPVFGPLWGEEWSQALSQEGITPALLPPLLLNPPDTPTPISGRVPFEQLILAASSDHGGPRTQILLYCPVGIDPAGPPAHRLPATATLNLRRLGPGSTFTFRFVHPDTALSTPPTSATVPADGRFPTPRPPTSALAECGAYVLMINIP